MTQNLGAQRLKLRFELKILFVLYIAKNKIFSGTNVDSTILFGSYRLGAVSLNCFCKQHIFSLQLINYQTVHLILDLHLHMHSELW